MNIRNGMLSVVIPAYNENENIRPAADTVSGVLKGAGIAYEIIFVNDGSKDNTWSEILTVSDEYAHIKGVNFSRNFGKEAAILAGLSSASGACTAVMDCDLQHPHETLPVMYEKWQEGYDVIEGVKNDRSKESLKYKLSAKLFYRIMSRAIRIDMTRASDFKLLDKKAVQSILSLPERSMFFRALSSWVGYKTTSVEFEVQDRLQGETKWSALSLIRYAMSNIISFTSAPMQIVTGLGIFTLLIAVIIGIQTIIKFLSGTAVEGFTTVIILMLFIGSIIMICMGISGIYIAKIYEEVKGRPRYIISEKAEGRADDK